MSAEVSRIEIKIGDKTISMTPDEAKELMQALESIFEQPVKQQFVPYPMPYPVYPTAPMYPGTWTVTSGTLASVNTMSVTAAPDSGVYFKQ